MRQFSNLQKLINVIKMNGNLDRISEYAYMSLFLAYCSKIYKKDIGEYSLTEFCNNLIDHVENFDDNYFLQNENNKSLPNINFFIGGRNSNAINLIKTLYLYIGNIEIIEGSIINFLRSLSFDEIIEAITENEPLNCSSNVLSTSVYDLCFKLNDLFSESGQNKCMIDLNSYNAQSIITKSNNFYEKAFIKRKEINYYTSLCRLIVNNTNFRELNETLNNDTFKNYADFALYNIEKERINDRLLKENYRDVYRVNQENNLFLKILKALNVIKSDGLLFAIVSAFSLNNYSDREYRERLLRSRNIKAIITLPKKLRSDTARETAIIILSKKYCNKIFMFDGTEYAIDEGRNDIKVDVKKIVYDISKALTQGEDYYVNAEKLLFSECNLLPSRNIIADRPFKNSFSLDSVADIFTGWQASSIKLERIQAESVEDENAVELLQASNINDIGMIEGLKKYNIPSYTVERYKLQNLDILVSNKSLIPKICLIEKLDGRIIVPFGSFIIIRPNLQKIDPYFLECYLKSNIGQKILKQFQSGSIISNLSIGSVKELPIPNIPYTRQRIIGDQYRTNKEHIFLKSLRIKMLEEKNKKLIERELERNDL